MRATTPLMLRILTFSGVWMCVIRWNYVLHHVSQNTDASKATTTLETAVSDQSNTTLSHLGSDDGGSEGGKDATSEATESTQTSQDSELQTLILKYNLTLEETVDDIRPLRNYIGENDIAICVISKDDNRILPEWLAYHYTVLPLRRLIMYSYPTSVTSPDVILQAYRDMLGINITVWRNHEYYVNGDCNNTTGETSCTANMAPDALHKNNIQSAFYAKCAMQLKKEGSSWALFIDTDEFISYNYYNASEEDDITEKGINASLENDTVFKSCGINNLESAKTVPYLKQCRRNGSPIEMLRFLNISFPPTLGSDDMTMSDFIDKFIDNSIVYRERKKSVNCDVLPRMTVAGPHQDGSIIELNEDATTTQENNIPLVFSNNNFRTLSYIHHDHVSSLAPKSLLHVGAYKAGRPIGIHRALRKCFNQFETYPDPSRALFRIHHYLGSLTEFLSRPGDSRRTADIYRTKLRKFRPTKDILDERTTTSWLKAFCKLVGRHRAYLLTVALQQWAIETDTHVSLSSL